MKGFIRILEAIIASIILLTSLTFFFNASLPKTNWDDTILQIRSHDILNSLEKSGILATSVAANNPSVISGVLSNQNLSMIPFTIDYSIQVNGIPNPVIYIGCLCSDEEIINITGDLSPLIFQYHNRTIEIRISKDNQSNIDNRTNVLLSYGYVNFTKSRTQTNRFLERGGTIFIIGDLTQDQVEDGIFNNTFGLKWKSIPRTSQSGTFYNSENENITAFRVEKYFKNITSAAEFFTFTGTTPVEIDNRTVAVITGSSQWSAVKTNKGIINGNGRTVWFSNYVQDSSSRALLKSTIMWASGESFSLDDKQKKILPKHISSRIIVFDEDVYEVVLTLWRVLQ